jgi:DNA modification methylase
VQYPEALHQLSVTLGRVPERVVSWVYNSNTAKQHRDIAFYGVTPDFKKVRQPYKNPNDKRIKERIARGLTGCKLYDWWNVNQVKNVSKAKTGHPCQMPLEVMKNIVGVLPEDAVIVDPFMGSGTTGVACLELGREFVGIEIDASYYEIALGRLEACNNEVASMFA